MALPRDVAKAHGLACEYFAGRAAVIGVGVGPRLRDGRPTGEPALKVLLDRSQPTAVQLVDSIRSDVAGLDVELSAALPPTNHAIDVTAPGEPWFNEYDFAAVWDDRQRRVLHGGIALMTNDPEGGVGTLGFFLESAVSGKAYGVSNAHVLAASADHDDDPSKAPGIVVYHPRAPTGRWARLGGRKTIGTVISTSLLWGRFDEGGPRGPYQNYVDAAIFELSPGVKYRPAVEELGGITAVATDVTYENVCLGLPYQVATRGIIGVPTGGWINCMSFYFTRPEAIAAPTPLNAMQKQGNALIVRANPAPAGSGGGMYFSQSGDSGSAVLNDRHELVGMLRAGFGPAAAFDAHRLWDIDGIPPDFGDTFVDPIADVVSAFASNSDTRDLQLQVALAEAESIPSITPRTQP